LTELADTQEVDYVHVRHGSRSSSSLTWALSTSNQQQRRSVRNKPRQSGVIITTAAAAADPGASGHAGVTTAAIPAAATAALLARWFTTACPWRQEPCPRCPPLLSHNVSISKGRRPRSNAVCAVAGVLS